MQTMTLAKLATTLSDNKSSSLSIPNESIDFDFVYSLHSFAASIEGQANTVKGDSLFLMDDRNSYSNYLFSSVSLLVTRPK